MTCHYFNEALLMNQVIGPSLEPRELSKNAKEMLQLRDQVLSEWGKRLRETVAEAENLPPPILINTLPVLYQNIVEAIAPEYPRTTAGSNTVASEHGGERARLTHYNVQSVISEYQLLRGAIFDVLKLNNVELEKRESDIVNEWIDGAIRESVTAFVLAEAALRERFFAMLTHDLRNPLAAAYASSELIRRLADTPKVQDLADRITANLSRMDAMIKDLLDAAVFHAGERLSLHLEKWDMLDLAKEVCDQFAVIHGPRFRLAGTSATGYWDRNTLKRAVENLIGNAAKYGQAESLITLTITSAHGRMMLTVHNIGEPMPPEEIECVFQVFQRAVAAKEGDKRGWGIGLPYVRSVAESHGGSVTADSAIERGTTFAIDIPIDARPYQNAPTLGTHATEVQNEEDRPQGG
jgi:signal transduction histidine kinase